MLVGAIFVYDYEPQHPHLDDDIMLLTLHKEEYIQSAYHNPGAQAAYTVEVVIDDVSYPTDDPVWGFYTAEGRTVNLAELDKKIQERFNEALDRCRPEYYIGRHYVNDFGLMTVDNIDTSGRYPCFTCSNGATNTPRYFEELTSGEFFEAYYGDAYSHRSKG